MAKIPVNSHTYQADRNKKDEAICHADAGLTLVELLVVLAILALFAGLAVPQVLRYLGSARTQTAQTQISSLVSTVELFFLDNRQYPDANIGLKSLIDAPQGFDNWNGPYLKKQKGLIDPWGKSYIYRFPGQNGDFDILSLGRDGKPGGSGEDRDVTSW